MKKKHSLKKQISNDYLTLLSLIGFLITIIFSIMSLGFGFTLTRRDGIMDLDNSDSIFTGAIFGILSLFCLLMLIFRINRGKYLVNSGLDIEAIISNVFYHRDRGRVEYSYTINEQEFKRGNGIHVKKDSIKYNVGEKINILVDPENNKKAIIKSNFVE